MSIFWLTFGLAVANYSLSHKIQTPTAMATISIRLTLEQKQELIARCKARGIKVSTWVRWRVFDSPLPHPKREIPAPNRELALELNRIGGNLNQITRSRNFGKFALDEQDKQILTALQATLDRTWLELVKLNSGIGEVEQEEIQGQIEL